MKVTIRAKLMIGYIAVLIFMIMVSIFAYITLVDVNKTVNQILVSAHKYDTVNSLRQSVKQFVDVSDSLVRGQIQDVGYYRSLTLDVKKKLLYVRKLRLKEHEKDFLKKVDAEFDSIQNLTEQSLKWTAALRNRNLVGVLKELDKVKPVIISSVDGLYDEAWRSLDNVTIMTNSNMTKGLRQILIFSVIAIMAGIGISIYISQKITTPIRALSISAASVAKGDLDKMVEKASADEIGELVASFNQMLVELKSSREQIEKYNKELKTMVDERTAELEKTKEYLENILEHSGDMIITTTLYDEIVQFNRGAENILGYVKEDLSGIKIGDIFVNKSEYKRIRKKVIEDGEISDYDAQLMKKSGDVIRISLTLSRLEDRTGNIIGLVGIGRNIGEDKKTI